MEWGYCHQSGLVATKKKKKERHTEQNSKELLEKETFGKIKQHLLSSEHTQKYCQVTNTHKNKGLKKILMTHYVDLTVAILWSTDSISATIRRPSNSTL